MKRGLLFLLVILAASSLMSGCASSPGELVVQDAWARPAPGGGNSAIYFTIDNRGGQADTLLSAASDAAGTVELHISRMDDSGNMVMEHQNNVPVPAGETVNFEPGGLHVMLMDLNSDLQPQESLTVTLTFEKAGSIVVEASVREP